MRLLFLILALAASACATDQAPTPALTGDQLRQYCLNQMHGARPPHSAPNWNLYDYCMRRSSAG